MSIYYQMHIYRDLVDMLPKQRGTREWINMASSTTTTRHQKKNAVESVDGPRPDTHHAYATRKFANLQRIFVYVHCKLQKRNKRDHTRKYAWHGYSSNNSAQNMQHARLWTPKTLPFAIELKQFGDTNDVTAHIHITVMSPAAAPPKIAIYAVPELKFNSKIVVTVLAALRVRRWNDMKNIRYWYGHFTAPQNCRALELSLCDFSSLPRAPPLYMYIYQRLIQKSGQ